MMNRRIGIRGFWCWVEVYVTHRAYSDTAGSHGGGPDATGYVALVLAWAIPGSGHFLIGEKGRGLVFALTIHGLFALGMLVGGLRVINPQDQMIWTYTQFLTGWPMLVANHLERSQFEPGYVEVGRDGKTPMQREYENGEAGQRPPIADESRREERESYAKKFIEAHPLFAYHPKVQDVGAVYCGIAGMLNLLVMFDVLLRITGTTREGGNAKGTETAKGRIGESANEGTGVASGATSGTGGAA